MQKGSKKLKSETVLPEGVLEQLVNYFLEAPEGSLLFRQENGNISILFFFTMVQY